MPYTGLTVVVPTRNRATLAMNAIRSILEQSVDDIRIFVSDNSTIDSEAETLSAFCDSLSHREIHYIRPPKPLPMSSHWDWAMKQSLEISESSHFAYLTDRMVFKNGELKKAIEIVKHNPDNLLSFNIDKIIDHRIPIRVLQSPWTGRVFRINSDRLLSLVSGGILHNCLPRMLNSIVPRSRILEIREYFCNVFDSISPDFSFCFRFLAIFDTIIYYDSPVLFHYALYRSNGESMAIGEDTSDHLDFIEDLGETEMNYASPIPQLRTVFNAIFHEYCIVMEQTKNEKFQEIERGTYLRTNAQEIALIENSSVKREMEALLVNHGFEGIENEEVDDISMIRKLFTTRAVLNTAKWLCKGSYTKGVWLLLAGVCGVQPPDDARFGFENTEEAIKHATRFPRKRTSGDELGEPLASAEELAMSP